MLPTSDHTDAVEGGDRRVAAFFDVDNTIVRGAAVFHIAVGLFRRGFVTPLRVLRWGVHQARYRTFGENREAMDSVRAGALRVIEGHSVDEMRSLAEDIYDEVLQLRIFPGTRRLLDGHLAAGHEVWLVTAGPDDVADLIARRLGVTGAIGTAIEKEDGRYTGRLVGEMLHGEVKAVALERLAQRERIDLASSYAYGDSIHDVAALSLVGHPVAINPDRRLRRHATRVGWPVHDFTTRG